MDSPVTQDKMQLEPALFLLFLECAMGSNWAYRLLLLGHSAVRGHYTDVRCIVYVSPRKSISAAARHEPNERKNFDSFASLYHCMG
jgi:hypothetical protein